MVELVLLETIGVLGTAAATIALVILLYRTVKQLEATVSLSRVQVEYRFRPWVGPFNDIKRISKEGSKLKYECTIKNYGELPTQNVKAFSIINSKIPSRDVFKKNLGIPFDLGPLLPNMLKHFWFFIDSELIENAKNGSVKIFSALYFEYNVNRIKNGYGMISEYVPQIDGFIHKDMWVDSPNTLQK
jgi:hypothetical protein